ncbi:unnamed protein product [Cyprideis torosa]|uniref:Uncharacterized protein n=1 Tax=Cyprideis torosa TaxID=163714 RepID=A0A7R8WI76_9CRUS|nr:unnamed protein product [Cyprideis torosa]CAG0900375.1 unnamed protein product [Cyprideis torosa]
MPQCTQTIQPRSQGIPSRAFVRKQENDKSGSFLFGTLGACLKPLLFNLRKGEELRYDSTTASWYVNFDDISDLYYLGSGAQGVVFKGVYRGREVAVKKVNDERETEIFHLRKLNHPNVVSFLGVSVQPKCHCLVMEYCSKGSLFQYLETEKILSPHRLVTWSREVALGMNYLHSHGIIHRDLKSGNILIDAQERLKISDFGTSKEWGVGALSATMSFTGTAAWMSPEVILRKRCSEKVDVWSYGVVLWEMLICEPPYRGFDQNAIIYGIGQNTLQLPLPESCPFGFRLLIQLCWKPKPKSRPCFKMILNHLDVAETETLQIPEDRFMESQAEWRNQVVAYFLPGRNTQGQNKEASRQLVKKRNEELRHAREIRQHYEEKLHEAARLLDDLGTLRSEQEEYAQGLKQWEESLRRWESDLTFQDSDSSRTTSSVTSTPRMLKPPSLKLTSSCSSPSLKRNLYVELTQTSSARTQSSLSPRQRRTGTSRTSSPGLRSCKSSPKLRSPPSLPLNRRWPCAKAPPIKSLPRWSVLRAISATDSFTRSVSVELNSVGVQTDDAGNGSGTEDTARNGNATEDTGRNGNATEDTTGNESGTKETAGNGNRTEESTGNGSGKEEDARNGNGTEDAAGTGNVVVVASWSSAHGAHCCVPSSP